jgi:hypothetical protein
MLDSSDVHFDAEVDAEAAVRMRGHVGVRLRSFLDCCGDFVP